MTILGYLQLGGLFCLLLFNLHSTYKAIHTAHTWPLLFYSLFSSLVQNMDAFLIKL